MPFDKNALVALMKGFNSTEALADMSVILDPKKRGIDSSLVRYLLRNGGRVGVTTRTLDVLYRLAKYTERDELEFYKKPRR